MKERQDPPIIEMIGEMGKQSSKTAWTKLRYLVVDNFRIPSFKISTSDIFALNLALCRTLAKKRGGPI